jgi:hypothetical protein
MAILRAVGETNAATTNLILATDPRASKRKAVVLVASL